MRLLRSQFITQGPTLFLKLVIFFIGASVLAMCIYLLLLSLSSEWVGLYRPILIGMCVASLPFFFGLYQALKLLGYIDQNKAFSELSVDALRKIKLSAVIISALYAAGMPYIYYVADQDDAPGGILMGLVLMAAPMVVAVFTAILQKLLQNAIAIKLENELTI